MTYNEKKEEVRRRAMYWQLGFSKGTKYFSDCARATSYFYRQGKRYGLLNEFRANGIL